VPHFEGLPLSKLPKEVEGFYPIEAVPFLEPVVKKNELSGVVLEVEADALLADGVVLLEPFLLLPLEGAVVDDFEVVGVSLVVF